MALLLNVETATKNCSVSLSEGGELLACIEIAEAHFSHAEKLHVFMADLLEEHGKNWHDVRAIAVSQGPGSYTGLRIGVSAVKGLCYALDIPMIAVDTLEVLARQLVVEEGYIVPMIDARRMEVYTAVYSAGYEQLEAVEALVVESDSFSRFKDVSLHFVGDGAEKCRGLLNGVKNVFYGDIVYPTARDMVLLSFQKFEAQDFVDVAYFEPFYLKDFVMAGPKKK